MEQRTLGKTGYSIGIITFGGIIVDGMEAPEAADVVAEAIDRGINYFDVAPSYGNAQDVLGPALRPHRKGVYLACKTGQRGAKEAQAELEASLRALQTDYLDNYQLHALNDPDEIDRVFGPGGAMETLRRAKEKGIVRNIGFTSHSDEAAVRIAALGDFATMLYPVNFGYRRRKEGSVAAVRAARERGMGILAIKALAHRQWREGEERTYPKCWYRPIYDDRELARMALNDTLAQDVDTAVPPGDVRMLRLALDIIEAQGGRAVALDEREEERLRAEAMGLEDTVF